MACVVIATAGHVDHGKSTLVRSLTGRNPDRLAEERRRGLTVDLGFAWTEIDDTQVAFVDVPGHRRFIGTMLAGLGPSPAVLFVVAADQGWQAQSSEHLAAIDALGIERGLLVITRADLAQAGQAERTLATAREHLQSSSLAAADAIIVSAHDPQDITDLRHRIGQLAADLPAAQPDSPVRIWIDRSFTIAGAGTVVTGTLPEGLVRPGDDLLLVGSDAAAGRPRQVSVRGVQSRDEQRDVVAPVSRVALNLRGISTDDVRRGDALVTANAFTLGRVVDVTCAGADELPESPTLHVGSADLAVHARPLGSDHARLSLPVALPWRVGDRVILRDPGSRRLWGGQVRDVEPPPLRRRGAAGRRAAALAAAGGCSGDLLSLRVSSGPVRVDQADRLGLGSATLPNGVERHGEWHVSGEFADSAAELLRDSVTTHRRNDPLSPGLGAGEAAAALRIPIELVTVLARRAGLSIDGGRLGDPDAVATMGPAEAEVAAVEERLAADPFAAPERDELAAMGLGARELATAVRLGRLLRLTEDIVLRPDAPARAMRVLAGLPQPFTTSEARQALGTTRRVAIPLLEHLDDRGWTRRVDSQRREVVR